MTDFDSAKLIEYLGSAEKADLVFNG